MKLAHWLALSTFLLPNLCIAQSRTDSVRAILEIAKRKGDSEKIASCLSHIGWEFLNAQQYDSALDYYYKSLRHATTELELTASTLECMGVAYGAKGYPDSSLLYYNEALLVYAKTKDTTRSVIIENNLSIMYKNKGLYERALESAFNALSSLERQKPDRALASCYNTIGAVYAKIADYPNALIYYYKALTIRQQIDYIKGVGQSYNNIGEVYSSMHLYDSALTNLFRSVEIKRKLGDRNAAGTTLNFIGEAYLKLNKAKEAEPYFLESRNIKRESGERLEEAIALNNLGKVNLITKNIKQAEVYINEAEGLIRKTGALDELRKNLELKVWLFKMKPDYPKALRYAEELMIVKDSLLTIEKAESMLAMQARYETEKKEQQITMLEQDKALQQTEIEAKRAWIKSLIAIMSLVSIIGLLSYYSYVLSQKNKRKVETLLKELHHRVKNNLQILSSVLSLQSQYLKDDDTIQVIKSSESRVNTMALIHKKLYNDESSRTINMKEYISELGTYLIHTYGFSPEKIVLNLNSDDINLDVDKAIPIGLILNELISNALKYAFASQPNPQLNINLTKINQNELRVEVSDNGMGISRGTTQEPHSFGLKMVNTLLKELKGKLAVTTSNGTGYVLQIPIA